MTAVREACLASLDTFFRANGLKVNESKFVLLSLGTRQNLRNMPSFTVQFRDKTLTTCSQAKNLGVTFDRYMAWEPYVSELSRRCVGVLSAIFHLRHCLPSGTLTTIVTALVFSHIASVFGNGWRSCRKSSTLPPRIISGRRKFEHMHIRRARGPGLAGLPAYVQCSLTRPSLSCIRSSRQASPSHWRANSARTRNSLHACAVHDKTTCSAYLVFSERRQGRDTVCLSCC